MSMPIFLSFFLLSLFFPVLGVEETNHNCKPTKCSNDGPIIQFPFRDKNLRPKYCGYNPGFDVICNEKKETVLLLSLSVQFIVKNINYVNQTVSINDPEECLDKWILLHQHVAFRIGQPDHFILFNCSAAPAPALDPERSSRWPDIIPCSNNFSNHLVYVHPDTHMSLLPLASCTKIHDIFFREVHKVKVVRPSPCTRNDACPVPEDNLYISRIDQIDNLYLKWSEPECRRCEAEEKRCKLNDSTITRYDQVFPCVPDPVPLLLLSFPVRALIACFFVATLASLVLDHFITETTDKNNQIKIEKFLEDQRALKPTRFSYSDLRRITLQFSEKLGEGGYGIVYKGKLLSSEINVAVKVLHNSKGNGKEFVNEVSIIGRIHHVNVVRLVGYCADGFRRALVYEFLPNESLDKFIFQSSSSKRKSLGWQKLRDIALGIAKGIEYLHEGCDRQILHFDIKPHNILLDQNFNPKICDFGLAKLCAKEQSGVTMTAARGTMGYIAPEVLSRTFGRVSHKSDVYSFGMLLLEMVGGRKNIDPNVNTSQVYFPQWIYNHLDLNFGDDFWAQIKEGEDGNIARRLIIVGLWCIQWCPTDRWSMKDVLQMLEGPEESLTIPPNPFPANINATNPVVGMGMIPAGRHFEIELPLIQETEYFST